MQKRLAESLQSSDPHLRGREGVHPKDQTRALCFAACLLAHLPNLLRPGDERLEDEGQCHALGAVQPIDDLLRVGGDLLQRPGPIEVLRAGYKPDFRSREFHTVLAKFNGCRDRESTPYRCSVTQLASPPRTAQPLPGEVELLIAREEVHRKLEYARASAAVKRKLL